MTQIWHLSIIEFFNKTFVTGTVLTKPYRNKSIEKNGLTNAKRVISSYATKPAKQQKLSITLNNKKQIVITDNNGCFSVIFKTQISSELKIIHLDTQKEIKPIFDYPYIFNNSKSNLNIISDIDETILKSYTKSISKRIYTTLFKPSHKRQTIEFTKNLFEYYKPLKPRFFYISKSESNLFSIISNFIKINNLPQGPLILTPYLNFNNLVTKKKDADFKFKTIEFLILSSEGKKFILVGDDSQKDINVYTEIAIKYPDQIESIFIRQTKSTINSKQNKDWKKLTNMDVKTYYFKKNQVFNPHLL